MLCCMILKLQKHIHMCTILKERPLKWVSAWTRPWYEFKLWNTPLFAGRYWVRDKQVSLSSRFAWSTGWIPEKSCLWKTKTKKKEKSGGEAMNKQTTTKLPKKDLNRPQQLMWESCAVPSIDKELQATHGCPGWENRSSPAKSPWLSNIKWSALKSSTY